MTINSINNNIKVGPKMDVDAKLFMERSFADFVIIKYLSLNICIGASARRRFAYSCKWPGYGECIGNEVPGFISY